VVFPAPGSPQVRISRASFTGLVKQILTSVKSLVI
jgi:hypothetical protein